MVVAGANVHATKLLRPTLESIVVDRPEGVQNLCLGKGYDNPTGHGTVADAGYQPHIRRIGEEKLDQSGEKTHPARRWVVERTLGWLSSAGRYWYATTRSHPITLVCSNWHVPLSGTAVNGASLI